MPRACLPTEIFVERVQKRSPQHAVQSAMVSVPMSGERKQAQTSLVKRSPVKKVSAIALAPTIRERNQAPTSPLRRSPVKKFSPKKSSEDPSPIDIWRERHRARQAALLHSAREKNYFMDADDDMGTQDSNIDMERASMMREHAVALARERYEELHDGNGMKNEEIRQELKSHKEWPYGISTWDLRMGF